MAARSCCAMVLEACWRWSRLASNRARGSRDVVNRSTYFIYSYLVAIYACSTVRIPVRTSKYVNLECWSIINISYLVLVLLARTTRVLVF